MIAQPLYVPVSYTAQHMLLRVCGVCSVYRTVYHTVRACVRCNLFIVTPLFVYPWSMCFCVVLHFFFYIDLIFFSVSISLFLYIWLDFL